MDVGVSVLEMTTFCGVAGNIVNVTGFEGADWPPEVLVELSAVTVIVYVWPGRSPLVIDTGVVESAIVCELLMIYVPVKPLLVPKYVIDVLADIPLAFMIVPTVNLPYMRLLTVSVVPEINPINAAPCISVIIPPPHVIRMGAAELPTVCALLT